MQSRSKQELRGLKVFVIAPIPLVLRVAKSEIHFICGPLITQLFKHSLQEERARSQIAKIRIVASRGREESSVVKNSIPKCNRLIPRVQNVRTQPALLRSQHHYLPCYACLSKADTQPPL